MTATVTQTVRISKYKNFLSAQEQNLSPCCEYDYIRLQLTAIIEFQTILCKFLNLSPAFQPYFSIRDELAASGVYAHIIR